MTSELAKVLRNTAYTGIGFGVLALQRAQVRRREMEADLRPLIAAIGRHLPRLDDRGDGSGRR